MFTKMYSSSLKKIIKLNSLKTNEIVLLLAVYELIVLNSFGITIVLF